MKDLKFALYIFVFIVCLLSHGNRIEAKVRTLNQEPVALPRSVNFPRSFSQFSLSDVLGEVFEDYDPSTGRVRGILNENRNGSLVRIDEAKFWRVNNREFLVILIGIASGGDYQFSGEGVFPYYIQLAVLRKDGNALSLVAKQLSRPYSNLRLTADGHIPDDFPVIWYTNHHLGVSLDLAPYRLNRQETLIGVRLEYMWLPALTYNTTLMLFRIEGQRIRRVFEEVVINREYPERHEDLVIKTVSTLSSVPTNSRFYDFAISNTIITCENRNDDADCGSREDRITQVRRRRELWRFNGERFNRVER